MNYNLILLIKIWTIQARYATSNCISSIVKKTVYKNTLEALFLQGWKYSDLAYSSFKDLFKC